MRCADDEAAVPLTNAAALSPPAAIPPDLERARKVGAAAADEAATGGMGGADDEAAVPLTSAAALSPPVAIPPNMERARKMVSSATEKSAMRSRVVEAVSGGAE